MASAINISQSEILDAIRDAARSVSTGPEDAFTVTEMVETTGESRRAITAAVRQLLASGQMEHVRVHRPAIDGLMRQSPGFRLMKKAKK